MKTSTRAAWIAWSLAAVYYFYQYALRSAPAVMVPQLSDAFGLTATGVASLTGIYYYGYSPFSLLAGAAIDRLGAKAVIPGGALITAAGAILFAVGGLPAANLGRFLQGAGGVFALVGAIYIASKNFPASQAATLIGATQMFGMAGAAAGQFFVGPMMTAGLVWDRFWIYTGIAGIVLAGVLFVLLPWERDVALQPAGLKQIFSNFATVFRNPQSILCGLIGGLLFVPTTVFGMTWGVRYLQDAHGFAYGDAVMRSATVPIGWIIGCPLMGIISDRIGRRKPVIVGGASVLCACLVWILYGVPGTVPPYVVGLIAGIASGAAMLPYTVAKEANPPELSGTASGVVTFVIFTFSAVLGSVFAGILENVSGGSEFGLEHYQVTFQPLLYGVGAAIMLTLLLKETGSAVRVPLGKMRLA